MPNFVFSFQEFLTENEVFEGTNRIDKRLSDEVQEEYNKLKIESLKKQIDLCKKHKVKCFVDYGSLLGLYRDGKLIKHDNDTDVAIFGETVTKEFLEDVEKEFILQRPTKMSALINQLFVSDENADDYHQIPYVGLALKGKDGKEIQVTAMSKKKIGVPGDFFFYYPYGDGKRITRYPGWEVQLTSAKHFDKLGTLKHDGYDFPIPGDPEVYLEYLYGKDWKTPKSNSGLNDDCEFITRAKGKAYCYSHREGKYKK
jgi:hypothetical protein